MPVSEKHRHQVTKAFILACPASGPGSKHQLKTSLLEGMVKSLIEHDLQISSTWKDVQVQEFNVQKDHIHLVCSTPPKASISEYMGVLEEIKNFLKPTIPARPAGGPEASHRGISPPDSYRGHFGLRTKNRPVPKFRDRDYILPHPAPRPSSAEMAT